MQCLSPAPILCEGRFFSEYPGLSGLFNSLFPSEEAMGVNSQSGKNKQPVKLSTPSPSLFLGRKDPVKDPVLSDKDPVLFQFTPPYPSSGPVSAQQS